MSEDTLCCCEYQNLKGEKSHLLACCCDCEAFDEIADRCFKCERVPTSLIDRFIDTCQDRLRLPGLTGGGASRVSVDVVVPIVIIPLSLVIAAIGPISTLAVLLFLPYFCYFFYRTWRRKTNKSRTKFFYIWGLSSLFYMYLLFEMVICNYSSVSVWDNLLITLSIIVMCVALNFAKMDPGVLGVGKGNSQFYETLGVFGGLIQDEKEVETEEDLEAGFEMIDKVELETVTVENSDQRTDFGRLGMSDRTSWCHACNIQKPPRSGHCKVCSVCIRNRDHHCVWGRNLKGVSVECLEETIPETGHEKRFEGDNTGAILEPLPSYTQGVDTCVGVDNHRSFLVAMTMFVLIGYYGSYLTVMSVCDPSWPHDVTCTFYHAYRDFKWGLCYAGAIYVAMVSTFMCVGLVHQIILISQNITSQELHRAAGQGQTKFLLIATNNPYNRGFAKNWRDFINKKRVEKPFMDAQEF